MAMRTLGLIFIGSSTMQGADFANRWEAAGMTPVAAAVRFLMAGD